MTLGIAAVLGIGGAFADHSFNVEPSASSTTVPHHAASQHQTLAQFVGLKSKHAAPAPAIRLTDERGRAFSLARLAGHPTLLTFLGPTCAETCPVVAAELQRAQERLAGDHIGVDVVIVNADPQELSPASIRFALARGPLGALEDAAFLTGSLTRIEPVWRSYAITIEVDPTTHALAYTSAIYLIDATGKVRDVLTPFANESFQGSATLPKAEIDRFASGIETYVEEMLR